MFAPYAEWPEEVKRQYQYDPLEAQRLLDEAGYPRGADGIRFEAGWDLFEGWGHDLDLAQIVKSYWDKIGVDVTIEAQPDGTVMWNRVVAGAHGGITFGGGRPQTMDPATSWDLRFGYAGGEMSGITDPVMAAIYAQIDVNLDREEAKKFSRELDMHFVNEFWALHLPVVSGYMLHQPWLKGYRGELGVGIGNPTLTLMYLWIDQEMKKGMGH
jgi:peptide/nickel transport system substrate-binding protein